MPTLKLPQLTQTDFRKFVDYCWEFYGPDELYGETFDHKCDRTELTAACYLRVVTCPGFEGDTIDREAVRDILLAAKNYSMFNDRPDE